MLAFQRLLIASAAFVVPAAALAAAPTQEPDSVFTKGKDVEWAEAHVGAAVMDAAAHRDYHREAQDGHAAWHAASKPEGSADGAFVRMHRAYHQEMNEAHRAFHASQAPQASGSGFRGGRGWAESGWTEIAEDGAVTRPAVTGRVSRRTLLKQVLERVEESRKGR